LDDGKVGERGVKGFALGSYPSAMVMLMMVIIIIMIMVMVMTMIIG
jgi:hypothetical protein